MKQVKNFCVFAAALGMIFGGIGLAVLCFRKPETASVLGGALLICSAAVFLAYRFLLRFAPRTIAGKRLDKCIKTGGMAWLIAYNGNKDIWRETSETEEDEETDDFGVLARLEQRKKLEWLFFSADREKLREAGLENGTRIWVCAFSGNFKKVWLDSTLELPEEGGKVRAAVRGSRLSENPEKYVFETTEH